MLMITAIHFDPDTAMITVDVLHGDPPVMDHIRLTDAAANVMGEQFDVARTTAHNATQKRSMQKTDR